MPVKFLHTADWQMGMKALQAAEKAKEVRARRFETAARVVELAKREATETRLRDDVALYPAPLRQKQSTLDPTAWMPVRAQGDERIRIGVAHGALDLLPERTNFPIAAGRAEETGLDYLALGDWHGFVQHGRTVYSGTMEQTSFSERDPGNVVVVEVARAGSDPIVALLARSGP